jgi:hypothetical protein
MDDLSRLQSNRPKLQERARGFESRLFAKLPLRRLERFLVRFHQTFRDRPGTLVPIPPEWATGVREEVLDPIARSSKQE